MVCRRQATHAGNVNQPDYPAVYNATIEIMGVGLARVGSDRCSPCQDQARSKRSRFMTLSHTAIKSLMNFS